MNEETKWYPRTFLPSVALLGMVVLVAACGDSLGPETSRIKIQLTDAPTDELAMAEVWISKIYLQGGGDDGDEAADSTAASDSTSTGDDDGGQGGRVELFNDSDNPLHFDLLTLRDGVTADLTGYEEITSGMYQSLRFVVDSARVTLVEGLTFEDGETSARLFTPSAERSGIKVKLNAPIDAEGEESTTLLVDFDVDQSFVIQSSAQGIRRVIFTPRLHEKKRDKEEAS